MRDNEGMLFNKLRSSVNIQASLIISVDERPSCISVVLYSLMFYDLESPLQRQCGFVGKSVGTEVRLPALILSCTTYLVTSSCLYLLANKMG